MPEIRTIVSDADGTLVDTVSLIRHGQHQAARTFLEQHGIPAEELPSYEEYVNVLNRHVGGSTRQTLERTVRAFYEDRTHHIANLDFDELDQMLDPIQDKLAPEYVKPFPGLADMLTWIGNTGIRLAIATSGSRHHIVRNFGIALGDYLGDDRELYKQDIDDQTKLEAFIGKIQQTFNIPEMTIVTCEDVGHNTKPHPMCFQLAMQRLEADPRETLALGDHAVDMQTAANAGIAVRVGITHGFDGRDALIDAGATHIISSLHGLQPLVDNVHVNNLAV
ncbi:HAD family hydrolase [Candidatus Saccharibacteria bacterium]|nr:HAD family hydrolase [Candidatus Saccharibacteria bacterium]